MNQLECVRIPGLGLRPTNGLTREVRDELLMWQLVGIGNVIIRGGRMEREIIMYNFLLEP